MEYEKSVLMIFIQTPTLVLNFRLLYGPILQFSHFRRHAKDYYELFVLYCIFISVEVLNMGRICHRHFCNTGSRIVYQYIMSIKIFTCLLTSETLGGHYYSLINLTWRSKNESEALLHIYKPITIVEYIQSTVLLNFWGILRL